METVDIGNFSAGKNNISKETKLPKESLREALNVDICDNGSIRSRPKYTLVYSGSQITSLYKRHFVENQQLKILNDDYTATVLNANIKSDKVSYCEMNDLLYYTDGSNVYDYNHEILGIAKPPNLVLSSSKSTGEPSYSYQAALVYIDKVTGVHSAPSDIVTIDSGRSVVVSNIVSKPGYTTAIYVSEPGGETLYYQGTKGGTISPKSSKHALTTANTYPLIGGNIIRAFNGRLYVAVDNVVYYSQPLNFGLYKPSEDFFMFADDISVLQPVENGLFIVADKTYYLSAQDPTNPEKLRVVSSDKGIFGTGISLDAKYFNLEFNGVVAYWFSDTGGVIGMPNGQIKEFSKDRLAIPNSISNKGSTMYTEEDGLHKIVTTVKSSNSEMRTNIGASDSATAQIIRNGVVI